jgi:hypothetical protein
MPERCGRDPKVMSADYRIGLEAAISVRCLT